MVTIALDEAGIFENSDNSEATFIGGVLYDDKGDKKDTENERKRIVSFYKSVLSKAASLKENESIKKDLVYPGALHSNKDKSRGRIVGQAKEHVNKYLAEFLKSGTVDGKEVLSEARKGEYYVFCLLKSDKGMTWLMDEDVNFMLKDDYASNLYYHMTTTIVERTVFDNPYIDVQDVYFNIATRSTGHVSNDEKEQYIKLKYEKIKGSEDQFAVGSGESYRVALVEKMFHREREKLTVSDFRVNSIGYEYNKKNMEFLYLSDSICTFLDRPIKVKNIKGYDKWLKSIEESANLLCGEEKNLLFLYDDVDMAYKKIWEAYKSGDYYTVYSDIYAAKKRKDASSKFYAKKWFDYIEKLICDAPNSRYISDAIIKLNESTKTNTLEQDKAIYVIEKLKQVIKSDNGCSLSKMVGLDLCDAGISLYNHIGKSKEALKYLAECQKYADVVEVPRYITLLTKGITAHMDRLQIDKSIKLAKKCLNLSVQMAELKPKDFYKNVDVNSDWGVSKSKSLLGQALALGRNPEAEYYFKEAMSGMEKNSPNYKITQSYLIHHYIDIGNQEGYQNEICEYFGGISAAKERFEYVLDKAFDDKPEIAYKFALWLFLRGLYTFEKNKINKKLKDKIYNISESLEHAKKRNNSKKAVDFSAHPVEIIYKYIALIACYFNDNDVAEKYMKLIEDANDNKGTIINLINKYSLVEYFDAIGDEQKFTESVVDTYAYAAKEYNGFKRDMAGMTTQDMYEALKERIAFMYH